MICLISRPLLIALRCDWYQSKGHFKGFKLVLRLWELSKIWWRYDQMKFVTQITANLTSTLCGEKGQQKEDGARLSSHKPVDSEKWIPTTTNCRHTR